MVGGLHVHFNRLREILLRITINWTIINYTYDSYRELDSTV